MMRHLVLLVLSITCCCGSSFQPIPSSVPSSSSSRCVNARSAAPLSRSTTHLKQHEGLIDMALKKKDQFVLIVHELEYHAQLEVAEALIYHLRKHTNGGMMPAADGSPIKLQPHQRDIIATYTPEAIKILDRLEKAAHNDARVYLYITEALGYDVSVKSILQAGPQVRRIFKNIDLMVENYPRLKGGSPYIVRGMTMLNAPPPFRNVKKARESFEAARSIDPQNPRNLYFCGVGAFLEKDFPKAYDYFSTALRLSEEDKVKDVRIPAEEPVDEYLLSQCHVGVQMTREGGPMK